MGKLTFNYGTMGAAKSAEALMCKDRYERKGLKVLLFKTKKASRDGDTTVSSRIGLSSEALILEDWFYQKSQNEIMIESANLDCIIVDEIQFARGIFIDMLASIVDTVGTPVICYGLKTDYNKRLFEGSKRLIEVADSINEIQNVCKCGKKAIFNIKLEGDDINGKYIACCRRCANEYK